MRGVANQERAALAEIIRDAMVDAVVRKPIYALHVDAHPFDHALADVIPRQIFVLAFKFLAHSADKTHAAFGLQRENGQKFCFFQADV